MVTDQVRKCLHKSYVGRFSPRKSLCFCQNIRISLASTTRKLSDLTGPAGKDFFFHFGVLGASVLSWQWCEGDWMSSLTVEMPTQGISSLLLQQRWVEACSYSWGGWVARELGFYKVTRLHVLVLLKHCRMGKSRLCSGAWALRWGTSAWTMPCAVCLFFRQQG